MKEFKILIPLVGNSSGIEHCPKLIKQFQDDLVNAFGGYTFGGFVDGVWRNSGGNNIHDRSGVYYVAIPDTTDLALFAILIDYRKRFDQECLYVAETSLNARLI